MENTAGEPVSSPASEALDIPVWFYLAGSLCFAVGTLIVLLRR